MADEPEITPGGEAAEAAGPAIGEATDAVGATVGEATDAAGATAGAASPAASTAGAETGPGAAVGGNVPVESDYQVGYGRPPKSAQFKPGQRANPRGRPRGSPNLKTIVERTLRKSIAVSRGDKTARVQMLEGIAETYGRKAAEGDYRAANIVISLAAKTGLLNPENDDAASADEASAAAGGARPSDGLVESVEWSLLSKDEQIDLSRLAERVDRGGDVTALSAGEFARLKEIVAKGRGKPSTPGPDDALREAA